MSRDDEHDERPEGAEGPPKSHRARLRGVARRLLDEQPVSLSDAKELLGSVLDTSDKARTEMIRMVGREVRTWLEGLGLQEGVHYLLTNYSLEVKASVSLKPLSETLEPPPHERKKRADPEEG